MGVHPEADVSIAELQATVALLAEKGADARARLAAANIDLDAARSALGAAQRRAARAERELERVDADRRVRFAALMREFDNAELRAPEIQHVVGACLRGEQISPEAAMRVLGYASRLAAELTKLRRGMRRRGGRSL